MKLENCTFQITENLVMENSFGIVCQQNNVTIEINIGWLDNQTGFYEIADIETGGNAWYAEGQLFLENDILTDYDGVFELMPQILDRLELMGIDVDFHR